MEEQIFISAIDLAKHPLRNAKQRIKAKYYYVLKGYVEKCTQSTYSGSRLEQYRNFLLLNDNDVLDFDKCESAIVTCRFQPWLKKYKFLLVCDLMLILCDISKCQPIVEAMKSIIVSKQALLLDDFMRYLQSRNDLYKKDIFDYCNELINQIWDNENFRKSSEKRIIVTANMSAGKSTLINAIIGNNLARTAQEACTSELSYFYNLPFNDGTIHFQGKMVNYSLVQCKNFLFEDTSEAIVATYFSSICSEIPRMCLIDTPGVNSAIRREHGRITKKCISEGQYDQLLYVLNAKKIGSEEEIAYLKWLYKNTSEKKVVFVLNQLDDFRKSEDSIADSIAGVRMDLQEIGYEKPEIFPISAYFAYLLKKEVQRGTLTDDEVDELQRLKKKFLKPEYNLSIFYDSSECGDDYEGFLRRSGLFYLENKLYGGLI